MNALESWILSYLVNSFWQLPLLFAAGVAAARALRRIGPGAEHRVWVGVLALQVILPGCSAVSSAWWHTLLVWNRGAQPAGNSRVMVVMGAGTASGAFPLSVTVLAAIVIGYWAIFAWFAARFLWRCGRLRAMRVSSVAAALSGDSARIWAECAQRFGVRDACVAISSRVSAPVTMGVFRKLLLFPSGIATRLSDVELQSVMGHEFAHMRRNDFLKNLLYELISLPVSFHPVLWLTRERLTESREILCDNLAADMAGRSQYSRSLLRLASMVVESAPTTTAHAVGILDTNTLERRLMRLAENQPPIRGLRRLAALAACVMLGAATCASALALHMQMNSTDASNHQPTMHPSLIHVSPKVMEKQLITKVAPLYPVEAKKAGVQGKVVLSAVIGKDGSVRMLKVDSGPKELQRSSLDAVRRWKYKPYLLNGEPIDVATTVNIIYTLEKIKK